MRRCRLATLIGTGIAMLGVSTLADPVLSVDGECPGLMTIGWENATPYAMAGLVFAHGRGQQYLLEPCWGTILDLDSTARLVATRKSDSDGRGSVRGHAPLEACGGFLQLVIVDGRPCSKSEVVQIPE